MASASSDSTVKRSAALRSNVFDHRNRTVRNALHAGADLHTVAGTDDIAVHHVFDAKKTAGLARILSLFADSRCRCRGEMTSKSTARVRAPVTSLVSASENDRSSASSVRPEKGRITTEAAYSGSCIRR